MFLTYISDLDNDISNHILKFADDTKIFRRVGSYDNIGHILRKISYFRKITAEGNRNDARIDTY